jgi:hypothetical protein
MLKINNSNIELVEGDVEEVGGREGAEERTRGRKGGGACGAVDL